MNGIADNLFISFHSQTEREARSLKFFLLTKGCGWNCGNNPVKFLDDIKFWFYF